jgi:DNA mismatch repair ATPase MutS
MEIVENSNDFIYTYKLLKGISRIKGGIKVLKDLNYPEEIIHNTKKIMKNIIIN